MSLEEDLVQRRLSTIKAMVFLVQTTAGVIQKLFSEAETIFTHL